MSSAVLNLNTATQRGKRGPANTFITILPWSSSQAENKTFTLIVTLVMCLTLTFAALIKWQSLPERPRAEKEKLPAQLTRLITAMPTPEPKPIDVKPKVKPVPKVEKPKPEAVVKPKPQKKKPAVIKAPKPKPAEVTPPSEAQITEQAREKAKQTGLLAFQDDLASMRDTPSLENLADTQAIQGAGRDNQTQRQFLGKNVSSASGGVSSRNLSTDIGAKGELAARKNTEYVAPEQGLASLAAKQSVEESESAVLGSRDIESIRKVLDASKGAIYAIYRRALRADPSLQGKLTVKLSIAPSGSVSEIELVFSELDSPALEQKLLRRIRLINFGEQAVTPTFLEYSFNFLPF